MDSTTPAIRVSRIEKSYGQVKALDGINLKVPPGQIMALLGRNGAGKTTLIDVILGLQNPTNGEGALFGMTPREAIQRSLIGVVHQTGSLPMDYTVLEALRIFASVHANTLPLEEIIEETHLEHLVKRRIRKLSGGEQQRMRLALALLPDPMLLILDEPTAGMDATARREFWDLMQRQAQRGRTIVFATHYLAEAESFAQRTVVIQDGRIVADAPTDELRRSVLAKTLRIRIPDLQRDRAADLLGGLEGSGDFCITWSTAPDENALLTLEAKNTDEAAALLLHIEGAHDLEIVPASLEDAFSTLTS